MPCSPRNRRFSSSGESFNDSIVNTIQDFESRYDTSIAREKEDDGDLIVKKPFEPKKSYFAA